MKKYTEQVRDDILRWIEDTYSMIWIRLYKPCTVITAHMWLKRYLMVTMNGSI